MADNDRPGSADDVTDETPITDRNLKETDRKHVLFRQYVIDHSLNQWIKEGLESLQHRNSEELDAMDSLEMMRLLTKLFLGRQDMSFHTEDDCDRIDEENTRLRAVVDDLLLSLKRVELRREQLRLERAKTNTGKRSDAQDAVVWKTHPNF